MQLMLTLNFGKCVDDRQEKKKLVSYARKAHWYNCHRNIYKKIERNRLGGGKSTEAQMPGKP